MVETEEVRTVDKKTWENQSSVAERASPKGVYFINFNQGGIRKIHINIFNINIYITFGRYFCDSAVGRSKDFKWALEIWAKWGQNGRLRLLSTGRVYEETVYILYVQQCIYFLNMNNT